MKKFKVGKRARVNAPDSRYHGMEVTVADDDGTEFLPVVIRTDTGETNRYEREELEVIEKKRKAPKGPQAYKGNGKHEWEPVTGSTWRLRVPSGWLYTESNDGVAWLAAATFVPMPQAVGYKV